MGRRKSKHFTSNFTATPILELSLASTPMTHARPRRLASAFLTTNGRANPPTTARKTKMEMLKMGVVKSASSTSTYLSLTCLTKLTAASVRKSSRSSPGTADAITLRKTPTRTPKMPVRRRKKLPVCQKVFEEGSTFGCYTDINECAGTSESNVITCKYLSEIGTADSEIAMVGDEELVDSEGNTLHAWDIVRLEAQGASTGAKVWTALMVASTTALGVLACFYHGKMSSSGKSGQGLAGQGGAMA